MNKSFKADFLYVREEETLITLGGKNLGVTEDDATPLLACLFSPFYNSQGFVTDFPSFESDELTVELRQINEAMWIPAIWVPGKEWIRSKEITPNEWGMTVTSTQNTLGVLGNVEIFGDILGSPLTVAVYADKKYSAEASFLRVGSPFGHDPVVSIFKNVPVNITSFKGALHFKIESPLLKGSVQPNYTKPVYGEISRLNYQAKTFEMRYKFNGIGSDNKADTYQISITVKWE